MHKSDSISINEKYMQLAISEACAAEIEDEVPIGAVLVSKGQIIASDHNRVITTNDPTAHAEILVLRSAAKKMSNYRLVDSILYVTIEPCIMCMGAIIHARIKRLVFGASDPKWGAGGSLYDFSKDKRLNHRLEIVSGVLEEESRKIIQNFFRQKR